MMPETVCLHNHKMSYNDYLNHYLTDYVKNKIVEYLYNREYAVLAPSGFDQRPNRRFMKVNAPNQLEFLWGKCSFQKQELYMNHYVSVAKYLTGLPLVKWDDAERRVAASEWREKHKYNIISYDYVIDIDNSEEDFELCYYSTKIITDLFDKFRVPYRLRFTGDGFHIVVPFEFFSKYINQVHHYFMPESEINIYKSFNLLSTYLHHKYTEMIDTNIYDSRRIIKIPYTLSVYKDSVFVCSPLSKQQFLGFSRDDYIYWPVKNVGSIYHNYNVDVLNNSHGNASFLINLLKDLGDDLWL